MLLLNAFSLNMVSGDFSMSAHEVGVEFVKQQELVSCVGHQETCNVLSALLGREIKFNRATVALKPGDKCLVAQYVGPRLAEGTTVLPEGATISFKLVEIY